MSLAPVPYWHHLSDHVSGYKALIVDLWGVIHDGVRINQDAVKAVEQARAAGLATGFLSNAPRPRVSVRDKLLGFGLPESLADTIVTSGGLARDAIKAHYSGAKLFHLGPDGDQDTLEGLPVDFVTVAADAEVILATGPIFKDMQDHLPLLEKPLEAGVPLLCANPDKVVHVGETLTVCAGALADYYKSLGGPLEIYGKPEPAALKACLVEMKAPMDISQSEVLVIGDGLPTDIAGAQNAGFESLFVAAGIHREEFSPLRERARLQGQVGHADFQAAFGSEHPAPTALTTALRW